MSHHSEDESLAKLTLMREAINSTDRERINKAEEMLKKELGPTNDFPHGKIVPHDEGGLMFGVTVFNGRVIFDFGKPIRSIGFTREGALELAELIKQRALQCPAIFMPNAKASGG